MKTLYQGTNWSLTNVEAPSRNLPLRSGPRTVIPAKKVELSKLIFNTMAPSAPEEPRTGKKQRRAFRDFYQPPTRMIGRKIQETWQYQYHPDLE